MRKTLSTTADLTLRELIREQFDNDHDRTRNRELIETAYEIGLADLAAEMESDIRFEDVEENEDRLDLTVIPRTVVSQAGRRVRL